MPATIFISYSRAASATLAHLIKLELEKKGIDAFVDVRDLDQSPGPFPERLQRAIEEAEYFVCLLAEGTLNSEWVNQEITHAYHLRKKLIPVFQEGFIPPPKPYPDHIHSLLHDQGVQILDKRGIFVEEAIEKIAQMVGLPPSKGQLKAIPRKTLDELAQHGTPEQRRRAGLLQKVRLYWVTDVLEQSLHGVAIIGLHMAAYILNPWNTAREKSSQKSRPVAPQTTIMDVFDEMHRSLLILGEPGSGKTTLLLELARNLITRYEQNADQNLETPMPVVFNLSTWEAAQSIADWLVEELNNKYQLSGNVARTWVENGQILPLLDGLDEVQSPNRAACVNAINDFLRDIPTDLVVCSRNADYEALGTQLNLQGAVLLQSLSPEQIDEYLARAGSDTSALREVLQKDAILHELAQSPLMLSVMILAYEGLTPDVMPKLTTMDAHREHLFSTYVQKMLEHKRTEMRYSKEQTLHWLAWLAQRLNQQGKTVFLIEHLSAHWLSTSREKRLLTLGAWGIFGLLIGLAGWLAGGLAIQTPHIGDGAAVWLLAAPPMGIGMALTIANALKRIFTLRNWLVTGLVFGVPFGYAVAWTSTTLAGVVAWLLVDLTVAFLAWVVGGRLVTRLHSETDIVENITWSLPKLLMGLVAGLGVGASTGLVVGLAVGSVNDTAAGLSVGLGVWLAFALMIMIVGGIVVSEIEVKSRPNQGIRISSRNALRIGSAVALVTGIPIGLGFLIPFGFMNGVPVGLALGLASGLSMGLMFGGFVTLQHFTLRFILARGGYMPHDYARFLDYAVERILLRRVGGSYIFVHRLIQEYFAALKS